MSYQIGQTVYSACGYKVGTVKGIKPAEVLVHWDGHQSPYWVHKSVALATPPPHSEFSND